MKKIIFILVTIVAISSLSAQIRVGDISKISGADSKQLVGYGLVNGLQRTGDSPASKVTIQSLNNMYEHFGLSVPENGITPRNTAAVMVTAIMPAFASVGSSFDIVVSAVGDASSLEGGVLLPTVLVDATDNKRYAIAQGPVSIGGFNEEIRGGNTKIRKNYTNTGRIPNGAMVENTNVNILVEEGEIRLLLHQADFTTAERVTTAINTLHNMRIATAENASNITILIPDFVTLNNSLNSFISDIQNLEVTPQQAARIVINERTGTIVAGGNVRISEVAIAHGNLVIKVRDTQALNLGPYSLDMLLDNEISAREQTRVFTMEAATVGELAQALNAIKVTPRDMISIFQSLKEAGALMAELRII
ncbi:MAG: flagellar basal body P-ring protein FlgI [Candidatus Cloacimonetes bacterium]|nr:flagellar basal body P-ring protein FlgI [Candidatus Cloacimonadota bacterium]